MKIALIGTRGVPARYGGFETCVEEVGRRLVARGHAVTVYCRQRAGDQILGPPASHLGMQLVYLPAWHKKSLETLTHTALSLLHLRKNPIDVAVVFNAANAPLLPMLRGMDIPVATHVDGLEWQRAKWKGGGRRFYRMAEALAVRWSNALIADARGISAYYTDEFGVDTELIAYGAPILKEDSHHLLDETGLNPGKYHLVVARFEPENHVDMVVAGYTASRAANPLVVVGSAPYADRYTDLVYGLADERVKFLGGVWDQELLDQLYRHATTYMHGHSVGGTNPSLLRAIGAGAPTIAFDVEFNREVLGDKGQYFGTSGDVASLVAQAEADPEATFARGAALQQRAHAYDWDDVAARYEAMCQRLVQSTGGGRRRSGRRRRGN